MVTIALSSIFQAALKWIFGVNPQPFPRVFTSQSVSLLGLQIQTVYVMEQGKVVLDGTADQLRDNEDVKEFYLGGAGDQRKSFKNLKSFKRRKRWL